MKTSKKTNKQVRKQVIDQLNKETASQEATHTHNASEEYQFLIGGRAIIIRLSTAQVSSKSIGNRPSVDQVYMCAAQVY
jgi:hypothetical protein